MFAPTIRDSCLSEPPVDRFDLERITIDASICHDKPVIRGMRLPVQNVLEILSSGMTFEEILADYEELERDDLLAVLT